MEGFLAGGRGTQTWMGSEGLVLHHFGAAGNLGAPTGGGGRTFAGRGNVERGGQNCAGGFFPQKKKKKG